jgi:hypothetical protein
MKTLRIQLTNPKTKKLLRDMASLGLLTILPKQKPVVAEPKTEKEKTPLERFDAMHQHMLEHYQKHPAPEMTMEEIVADIKEYRKEKRERENTLYHHQ